MKDMPPHPVIRPVILCGGAGSRLWPLSRKTYPKQFARLIGDESLLQNCVRRFHDEGFLAPFVVTGEPFRFMVAKQLAEAGLSAEKLVVEPFPKDTAPAVIAGTRIAHAMDPDALILVAPSDHLIPDTSAFCERVRQSVPAALNGQIVTFGVKPLRPETGYGYLLAGKSEKACNGTIPVDQFLEKPDIATAQALVEGGGALWNTGIYLFRASVLIDLVYKLSPDLLRCVSESVANARESQETMLLGSSAWNAISGRSIDYEVMERAINLSVMPFEGAWTDLGDWNAVWRETQNDGIAQSGRATALDCANTLLRSEVEGQAIVGIGLEDIVAVAMPDAVLVSHKSRAQDVKVAVQQLKAANIPQAENYPKDHRPWGWFESLTQGDRFQVKRIRVHPGGCLSLQSHNHRAEHWIVVEGTARVTIEQASRLVSENQSIYVPLGAKHRLENPGKVPLTLIEVQTGAYLGEDDIMRHDDIYART